MLQCELEDGRMLYVNMDNVFSVSERTEGGLVLGYANADGQKTWSSIKRFQIAKNGVWYK